MSLIVSFSIWCYLFLLTSNTFISLLLYRKSKNPSIKHIFILLVGSLLIQIASDIFAYYAINNHFFSHIYLYFQFFLIGIFYYYLFQGKRRYQLFVKSYLMIVTAILVCYYIIFPSEWQLFNPLEILLTMYLMIICPLMYLYKSIDTNRSLIYINIGILSFGILSSFIFLYINILVAFQVEDFFILWLINYLVSIFFQVMITIQFVHSYKKEIIA